MKKAAFILSKCAYFLAIVFVAYLTLNAFHYTFNFDLTIFLSDDVFEGPDSRLKNLLVLTCIFIFFYLSPKLVFAGCKTKENKNKRVLIISSVISITLAVLCGIWVIYAKITPWFDQETVYHIAQAFNKKDYFGDMTFWLYLKQYPQEFGLVFLEAGLLKIWDSYLFLQLINALLIGCIIFFSVRLVLEITDSPIASLVTLEMISVCFPLYYYVSFVYGDIFYIFSAIFISWLGIKWIKTDKIGFLIGIVIHACILVPARKNALIFLIALAIVLLLEAMKRDGKRFIPVLAAVLIIVLPLLSEAGIRSYYEHKADYKIDNEIPSINWVVMGLRGTLEEGKGVGFFDGYVYWNWNLLGQDKEATKKLAYQHLSEFMEIYKNDPAYAYRFFRYKALEQWTEPTFASIYMTTSTIETNWDRMRHLYTYDKTSKMALSMNYLQSTVYCFSLICFIAALFKKKEEHFDLLIAIFFVGGFLFSLLWEAGGRYVFPYFVMLIPAAGAGTVEAMNICNIVFTKIRSFSNGKSDKELNSNS